MGLAEVLAAHLFTLYPSGEIVCDCEWARADDGSRTGDGRMIAAHVAHVATAVLAWLETLAQDEGVREAVGGSAHAAWFHDGDACLDPRGCAVNDAEDRNVATAAVTAFLAAAREA